MDATPEPKVVQETTPLTSKPVNPHRLSLPLLSRVFICMIGGFSIGAVIGATNSSQEAGLRFRAENSHRLPKSEKGWFLYHKTKNYQMMLNGIKGSFKTGSKLSVLMGGFFVIEEVVDRYRKQQDFLSTTIAGASLGGLYSLWQRLPRYPAWRTVKLGLLSGLALGLSQDALALMRGRRLAYIDLLLRRDQSTLETGSEIV